MYFGSTASQAIVAGAVVAFSSGRLIPAANDTEPSTCIGVIKDAITSSDTAYATAGTLVAVEVPVEKNVVWECGILADDLANTDQGTYMDLTTADTGDEVDTAVSTLDTVFCVGYITASLGKFVLNIGADYFNP